MDTTRLWLPAVHRFAPTLTFGPAASRLLSGLSGAGLRPSVHVTRQLDIKEILERDDDFSVRPYDEKMTATSGPFYLGMNELSRYQPDADVIWRAVRREDAELVRRIVAEETASVIRKIGPLGRIDVVKDLAEVVHIRFVSRYYGIDLPDSGDVRPLLRLFQETGKYLFVFWTLPGMHEQAVSAGRELRALLERQIAERRQNGRVGDGDVLGRMLAMNDGFVDGDAGIARSIAGLSSGSVNAPLGLFTQSVDRLMSLDGSQAETVRRAARLGAEGSEPERAAFRDYLLEAERFCVYPPFSYRRAERDTVIAKGTSREKHIREGTIVVAWQSLAAFDPEVFEHPFEFMPGRPKSKYLGFGHGRHRCLGEHIGQVMLEEMARALFALPRIRRAEGVAGEIQFLSAELGKFPASLTFVFDNID